MAPDQPFLDLLQQYKNGPVTPAVEEQLMELVQSGRYDAWLGDDILSTLKKGPVQYTWSHDRSQQVLNQVMQGAVIKRLPRRYTWNRYVVAAAVLLLIAYGSLFLAEEVKHAPVLPVALEQPEIKPGAHTAILTLADGSSVVLDSTANGMVRMQQGIQVSKQGSGQLVYSAPGSLQVLHPVFNSLTTPRGGQYQVTLPDGTRAWLNAASSLKYPVAFTGKERRVEFSGEGYFEVAANQAMPFIVEVNEMEVRVLGTHFNIMAYREEGMIKTTLLEGAVQLVKGTATARLKPGEQGILQQQHFTVTKADVEESVAWKNGFFQLEEAGVEVVMNQLSRWYNVEVDYPDGIPDVHFTAYISRNTSLQQVLKMLSLSKLKYRVNGRSITVLGDKK
jgi:ferric-dicitrate binding protein FerR (iron transport regulator)